MGATALKNLGITVSEKSLQVILADAGEVAITSSGRTGVLADAISDVHSDLKWIDKKWPAGFQ